MRIINTKKFSITGYFNKTMFQWTLFGIYISWGEKIPSTIENIHKHNVFIGITHTNESIEQSNKPVHQSKTIDQLWADAGC